VVFRMAQGFRKRCPSRNALYFAVSCCLTSIIGREYNFFAQGIMVLWLRDQLPQTVLKTKFLSYKPYFDEREIADAEYICSQGEGSVYIKDSG